MNVPFVVRRGTLDDVAVIVHHRRAMFEDMRLGTPTQLDEMDAAFEPWLRDQLRSGDYLPWFAEADGAIVSGVGLWVMDWGPGPLDPSDRRAYVVNVYTEPAYRGCGLATRLMRTLIAHCREQGFRSVSLHASTFGRPLYEALGFTTTNEMRLDL